MKKRLLAVTKELLNQPTAPFREDNVRRYIRRFCKARNISVTADRMGNLIATHGPQYKNTTFAFAAHMDHPGFIIEKDSKNKRTDALFYGFVEEKYFKGQTVRFFSDDTEVLGKITKTDFNLKQNIKRVWFRLEGNVKKGALGMWDLAAFRVKGDKLYSRSCDDIVGCAAVLSLLDELCRRKIKKKVMAIFTVAEEAGFQGAKYICTKKRIPKSVNLIAIETSSRLPTANIGDGVVIRVGDRLNIFTPTVTAFMVDIAKNLKSKNKNFKYQRKLMDGGTCESTIYNAFGYTNGAVCIPLGNYHNRNVQTGQVAPEFVSVNDLHNMVLLFVETVKNANKFNQYTTAKTPVYKLQTRTLGEKFFL